MKKIIPILFILSYVFTASALSFAQEDVSYYTCGMHPSVKVSPQAYKTGDTKCPICHMPLTPVMKQAEQVQNSIEQNVVSRVNIADHELKRAGVQTEPVTKRHLFKEIRTVGTVAYDPKLAVAQDEYTSSVKALDKIKEGKVDEVIQRAQALVNSAKRKLLLLGLSEKQIEDLNGQQESQSNLILPDTTVWIYGDVYEYELPWIKEGSRIKVTSASLPGEEFYGEISSVNPVLNPMTRTVRFRVLIENPDLKLKPQMYVNVWVSSHYMTKEQEHEVLSIPKKALLDTGARKIVWVEKSTGNFEGRIVEVGPLAMVSGEVKQFYPVLSGLEEGESVVTSGNFLIDSQSQITGSAAVSFGGALGDGASKGESKGSPAGHIH